jgi:hypothetical protein
MSACEYGTQVTRQGNALTFASMPNPQSTTPRHLSIAVTENQPSSHRPHHFPTGDMTDQPGSARFQALLESALNNYEKKTGVTLGGWEYSLAVRLQRCRSIDDITTLLQDKTQALNDFRQRDRIFKSIRATVSILTPISAVTSIADDASLVRQKALKACFTFQTIFTEFTSICESDTFDSRYPAGGMYHSQVHR